MTTRRTCRLAAEDGFTLTELLVAMMVSTVVLFATLGAFDAFNSGVAKNSRLTDATDAARRQVAEVVGSLRDAGDITRAGGNDIVFQSTSWPGESGIGPTTNYTERYCVNTATRTLWFNGVKSAGASAGPACPSTAGGWTSRVVASNVLTDAPVFVYGSAPVRSVSINLRLESGTALKPRPLELRSGGALRGALPPQVTSNDVNKVGSCEGGKALLALTAGAGGASAYGAKISAPNGIPVGPGQILVPATSTPQDVTLTITNLSGLKTVLTKSVNC